MGNGFASGGNFSPPAADYYQRMSFTADKRRPSSSHTPLEQPVELLPPQSLCSWSTRWLTRVWRADGR
jgi:hypothetical protein